MQELIPHIVQIIWQNSLFKMKFQNGDSNEHVSLSILYRFLAGNKHIPLIFLCVLETLMDKLCITKSITILLILIFW